MREIEEEARNGEVEGMPAAVPRVPPAQWLGIDELETRGFKEDKDLGLTTLDFHTVPWHPRRTRVR